MSYFNYAGKYGYRRWEFSGAPAANQNSKIFNLRKSFINMMHQKLKDKYENYNYNLKKKSLKSTGKMNLPSV